VFTLLHTNDFHNHLRDRQARRLQTCRQELGTRGLLLDAGDAIASGNVTFRPGGEPILERMTRIGYDAMTVGNREFHVWPRGLRCKLFRAGFPVLCANLRPSLSRASADAESLSGLPYAALEPHSEERVRPYIVIEPEPEWRIVVFGLTVPMVTERMLARKFSAYVFDDPVRTGSALAPALRQQFQPRLLVALTHIGIAQDRRLAAAAPDIDIIIGGHTHIALEQGERVGDTLIAHAGCFAHFLGRIEIETEAGAERAPTMRASLETL